MPIIDVQNVIYQYRGAEKPSLNGVNLQIEGSQLFGLLGPNGAGKTTLISILAGLLVPQSGNVTVDGLDVVTDRAEIQQFLSLVPQEYAFYPNLTVTENLRFFAGVAGVAASDITSRINEVVAITGLEPSVKKRAEQLSGGIKRRLNIAIGLLNRPRLLILDEPTVGIDPQSRHFILESIKQISGEGVSVIYTSHYMEEVEFLCDQIAIIDDGNVLTAGLLRELLGGDESLVVDLSVSLKDKTLALNFPYRWDNDGHRLIVENLSSEKVPAVISNLGQCAAEIRQLHYGKKNLEAVFLEVTGHRLRD